MQGKPISSIFIGIMVVVLLLVPSTALAGSSDFIEEGGGVKNTEARPAINPDFAPDDDCSIEHELKCIPGAEQECPEGFNPNEDNICGLDDCLEGYVVADEDESGLCITYEECESGFHADNNYILIKDDGRCALGYFVCDDPDHRDENYCIEYCDEKPDQQVCDPQEREKRDANAALWCDGNPRGYGDDIIAQLPKLEDDKCFGTCEIQSKGLACDTENRQ
jgi:hypothetical protein